MINSLKKQQLGLSLIELMIAAAIGIFLTAGLIQLFTSSQQTYRIQDNQSRLQENLRFAFDFISHDIRMADHAGCKSNPVEDITNHLNALSAEYDMGLHNFATGGVIGMNGPTGEAGAADAPDNISILKAIDSGVVITAPMGNSASDINISTGGNLELGDLILIADCESADIFQVSNTVPVGNIIVHDTTNIEAADGFPGNTNTSLCTAVAPAQCLSTAYTDNAQILQLVRVTYDIAAGQNGQLALFRTFEGNRTELIEGIENMQILYGEDTNHDNTVDYYVPAGTPGLDMRQVVSIKISLLATSIEDNLVTQPLTYTMFKIPITSTDLRLRRVFTTTIALRNRLL